MTDTIHTRIKKTRLARGLSQSDLAQATHVSQPTVANWENSSHIPRPLALDRISKAKNVKTSWLLAGVALNAEDAASTYLSSPIKHVSIYSWPEKISDIYQQKPVRYVPFATPSEHVIGLISEGGFTSKGTILLFDFSSITHENSRPKLYDSPKGVYVALPERSQEIKSEDKSLAELCAALTIYDARP